MDGPIQYTCDQCRNDAVGLCSGNPKRGGRAETRCQRCRDLRMTCTWYDLNFKGQVSPQLEMARKSLLKQAQYNVLVTDAPIRPPAAVVATGRSSAASTSQRPMPLPTIPVAHRSGTSAPHRNTPPSLVICVPCDKSNMPCQGGNSGKTGAKRPCDQCRQKLSPNSCTWP